MNIIPRYQAITQRLDRYYTNLPCKRGHLSERYTVNSCCIDCLHPKFISTNREAKLADRDNYINRENAKRKLKVFNIAVHRTEVDHFTKIVLTYANLRAKSLRIEDIRTKQKNRFTTDTLYIYGFRIHREDIVNLRDIAMDLNWRNMSDLEQTSLLLNPNKDGYVPPPLRP